MNVHLAAFGLAVVLPAAALAQQEATAPQAPDTRSTPELNGHVFMPSLLIEPPFRETTFKLGLLYGYGDATGPRYEVQPGTPPTVVQNGTNSYTFASFAQTFRYDYRFLEWLSAGVTVLTSLYSGLNGPSIVSIGAEVGIGAGLNVKAGHRFGPVETAVGVEVSNEPQYGILVAAALIKAIRDGVIDSGAALNATHTRTVNPFVAAAWAPLPALGLTVNVGYIHKQLRLSGGEIVTDQDGIQFAGAADFDFGKISSVPIGLLFAYRLNSGIGDSGIPKIEDVTGGIFYTARREIGLGLEAGWRGFTIRPPLDSNIAVVQLGLQYYW